MQLNHRQLNLPSELQTVGLEKSRLFWRNLLPRAPFLTRPVSGVWWRQKRTIWVQRTSLIILARRTACECWGRYLALRRTRQEKIRGWRWLLKEELYDFQSSPNSFSWSHKEEWDVAEHTHGTYVRQKTVQGFGGETWQKQPTRMT